MQSLVSTTGHKICLRTQAMNSPVSIGKSTQWGQRCVNDLSAALMLALQSSFRLSYGMECRPTVKKICMHIFKIGTSQPRSYPADCWDVSPNSRFAIHSTNVLTVWFVYLYSDRDNSMCQTHRGKLISRIGMHPPTLFIYAFTNIIPHYRLTFHCRVQRRVDIKARTHLTG